MLRLHLYKNITTNANRSFSNLSASPTDFARAERRHARYRHLVNGLTIPHPNVFFADGVEYGPLPYTHDVVPEVFTEQKISPERLRILRGYFAGDGSVRLNRAGAGFMPMISISSTARRGERLLDFQMAFGGAVHADHAECGFWGSKAYWYCKSESMRPAASSLASCKLPKSKLLKIISEWPEKRIYNNKLREDIYEEFQAIRAEADHQEYEFGSIEEFGGYCDARLSIAMPCQRNNPGQILLMCTSTRDAILLAIDAFLQSYGLPKRIIAKSSRGRFMMNVQKTEESRVILELIKPYVRKQKQTVEWCLKATDQNAMMIREKLFSFNDNHSVLRRKNSQLFDVAHKIRALRSSQYKYGRNHSKEIDDLVKQRSFVGLCLKNERLRERARDLICRGAHWSPDTPSMKSHAMMSNT